MPGAQYTPPVPVSNLPGPGSTTGPAIRDPKKQPYKTEGYQAFSKWMASDDDFFVLRKFEALNAATILWMQHRISELEHRLQQIHKSIEESKDSDNLKNSSFKWDAQYMPERTGIMCELSGLLLQYSKHTTTLKRKRTHPAQTNS
jgi:hypothetical protein